MNKKVYVLVGATEDYDLGATVYNSFDEAVQGVLHMIETSVEPEEWVSFRDKYAEAKRKLDDSTFPEMSVDTEYISMTVNTEYEGIHGNMYEGCFFDLVKAYMQT